MAFCGHCGYQLRPGDTSCPRCGTLTEPIGILEDADADSPTIATNYPTYQPSQGQIDWQAQASPRPATPPQPQPPLILRSPDGSFGNDAQSAGEGTNRASAQGSGYPGFAPSYYADVHTPYPATSHPGFTSQRGASAPRRRGLIILLLLILFVLLASIGAGTWYILTRQATTNQLTPSQQAQMVLQQFYDDINNRNYQGAYNLLGRDFQQSQSYSNFANGFTHTRHDDITFDGITPLSDGTVKVAMTINATEDAASGSGTQLSTYKGTYIVGQENGSWKILSGTFTRVA